MITPEEEKLIYQAGRKDLIDFSILTNPRYTPAWIHEEIARQLMRVESGEIKRLMLFVPPRYGKSELGSINFPAYFLGRNPEKEVIVASYSAELAQDFGFKTRNLVNDQSYQDIFKTRLREDSQSKAKWLTQEGGGYTAVGVGGAITGRGADLFLIDDPLKNRAEAESKLIRDNIWSWYTSTAYTRLEKDAAVVLIMCMVGDTKVLMADCSEKELKDVRPGDIIATYENGKLSTSTVINWANQGKDKVFTVKMKSGISIKANERHPFLTKNNKDTKWIQIKNLKVGDKIIKVTTEKQKQTYTDVLNTYEIILDEIVDIFESGYEDVFDIQVDRTENFIANGLVSHNTRWHLDDLAGRLLKAQAEGGEQWTVVKFPAIATEDEEHRKIGEPLWKEKYNLETLETTKNTVGTYDWSSLYQQNPVLTENQEFKPHWFKTRTQVELDNIQTRRFLTIDTAISKTAAADFTGICDNQVDVNNFWNLKAWRVKVDPKELIDLLFTLQNKNQYETIGIEKTIYLMVIKPFLDDEQRKRNKFLPIVELHHNQINKELRIRGLIPRYESGSVFHIHNECTALEEELLTFPKAINDDVCLDGDTLVATIKGNKKIKDIRIGDRVITPTGYKKVLWAGTTGEKEVITNIGITGTAEHRVFNGSSFDNLDTIAYNNYISRLTAINIIIWKYKKLLYSMENPMASWAGRESIILVNQILIKDGKILKDYMWRFGSFIIKRKFRKGLLFIIKTGILLTIGLKIWSAWKAGNIYRNILRNVGKTKISEKKQKNILEKSDLLQKFGTLQKKAESGTVNTLRRVSIKQSLLEYVLNAKKSLKHRVLQGDSVKENVAVNIIQGNLEDEIQITTKRKVYNLEIEDDGCYYANGVLVSNCDATAYQNQIAEAPVNDIADRLEMVLNRQNRGADHVV